MKLAAECLWSAEDWWSDTVRLVMFVGPVLCGCILENLLIRWDCGSHKELLRGIGWRAANVQQRKQSRCWQCREVMSAKFVV